MVRTRSFGVKAGGKSSKKTASSAAPASSTSSSSGSKKSENGNSVQVQPTPAWQREITGFLGNPAKKPRLEDDNSIGSTKEVAVEAEKPADGDKSADKKGEDESVNGSNSLKESKVSSEVVDLPEKEEKEKDSASAGQIEKVLKESANGCKASDNKSEVDNEDVSLQKDTQKIVEKNGSVLPVLADGKKKVE